MSKIKLMTISDNPIGKPTGVGTQTRYMIEGLLKTGKYAIVSLGAVEKNQPMNPIKTEEYGEDWTILPIKGYGDQGTIRRMLMQHKPDILWFMTDPHYYWWLWNMENEIRANVHMVYYHVWDNLPYPIYNKKYYDSNDCIVTISKLTDDIVRTVAPDVRCEYLPHAVNPDFFKRYPDDLVSNFRKRALGKHADKFVLFWNNRNQRRKMAGSLIFWFKDFLDQVGHDKAVLLMHTNPKEPAGPDLEAINKQLGLVNGEVLFSTDKGLSPDRLAMLYNISDCGVNISDAEGFGLNVLESLACGVPMIANMTGGIQDQMVDADGHVLGYGIPPASKTVNGSQEIPYIYEDRISREQFLMAINHMYSMSKDERRALGDLAIANVESCFSFTSYQRRWDEILSSVYEKGSTWPRTDVKSWRLMEM